MVYTYSWVHDAMDDYGNDSMKECPYCNIEREEFYMGGGLYCYECPRCGSRMESKK